MQNAPKEYRYSKTHEWLKELEDDLIILGITQYAQEQLGDIVYLDYKEKNQGIAKGDSIAVAESVKSVSEIFSPISGVIVEVNQKAIEKPEIINQDCYKNGWILKIKNKNLKEEMNCLMSFAEYQRFITE